MKFKIALVGCGRIAKNHFDAIQEEERFELVGVCYTAKERAQKAGKEYNVPYFLKLKEMLDKVEMDILAICTPSGIHPQNGILAAEHGDPVAFHGVLTCGFVLAPSVVPDARAVLLHVQQAGDAQGLRRGEDRKSVV